MRQIPRYGHWHAHIARLLFASCMPRRCTIHHPRRGAHFRPVPFPRLVAWHQGSMFCFGECGLSTFKDARRLMVERCEVDPSAFRGNRRGLFQTPWAPQGGFILSCPGKHDGNPRSVVGRRCHPQQGCGIKYRTGRRPASITLWLTWTSVLGSADAAGLAGLATKVDMMPIEPWVGCT